MKDIIDDYKNNNEDFNENIIIEYMAEILLGLHYLHENGIVFKNLKSEDIWFDKKGNLKISNYGIAMIQSSIKDNGYSDIRSYCFMSPEALRNTKCGSKSDVWSLGCIIHEMCCLEVIFYRN